MAEAARKIQPAAPDPAEHVDLGDMPRSVGFMLRMAQVACFDAFYKSLADETVKPGGMTVLWVIGLNPGIRQGTLARTLRIKPAHMTKLVQRHVEAGFVDRTVPDSDRRAIQLSLTKAGRAYCDANAAALDAETEADRLGLSKPETAQLLALLDKLAFREGP